MNLPNLTKTLVLTSAILFSGWSATALADGEGKDYTLAAGDVVKIEVFQNPDLTTEALVSENGNISYPLIGQVKAQNLTAVALEKAVAQKLHEGRFVNRPHVSVAVLKKVGNSVSVLGQVNAPGRYALDSNQLRLTDVLSMASGINAEGDDKVIVTGVREGKNFKAVVDVAKIFMDNQSELNMTIVRGDTLYVHRAEVFYVYGQSQRSGAYRVERGMTVMQAVAKSGGITPKGTLNGIRIQTTNAQGKLEEVEPELTDLIKPNDVLFIRESIF